MKKLNIVVVGTMASDPFAGMAWMHMQIILGLSRLGHNVYYFEITSTWPYNPVQQMRVDTTDYAIPYLKKLFADFGIPDMWSFRSSFADKRWFGMSETKSLDMLENADLVFNISGSTRIREEGLKTGRLVYYGTDPVYSEIKYFQGDVDTINFVNEHDDVVTYGENIGNVDCLIPPLPRLRAKTRQPVLMDFWESSEPKRDEFTTVGNWKQSGRDLEFLGDTYYWSKHHEFLKFIDLPRRITQTIELATNLAKPDTIIVGEGTEIPTLGIDVDDYSLLLSNGWKMTDGPSFSTDPWKYREYILNSKAEFTFAKDQNIRLRSGWFSERSACYLAAGRPVVTQDTGFGSVIPTGTGLFSFNNMDEIINAIDAINSNYKKHSIAAREIASEYFRAEKVMNKVLADLGF
jgi:hypothetical protein